MDLYLSMLFETVVLAHACYEINDSISLRLRFSQSINVCSEPLLAYKARMQMRTHLPWPSCIGPPAKAAVSLHTAV